eukprot:TRINITY_DN4113_c0_g2_i1.p1 TRINITY_DN4113_c0_g2~~TRINITY_DN4113_c0_g2_i1.p1  ORF type:complete len:396 (+),score=158.50 TRINITY_DN4113_c0_g2_i1:1-1188(+)
MMSNEDDEQTMNIDEEEQPSNDEKKIKIEGDDEESGNTTTTTTTTTTTSSSSSSSNSSEEIVGDFVGKSVEAILEEHCPQFNNKHDAVFALLHAVLLNRGFKLKSIGDGEKEIQNVEESVFPVGWNQGETYCFKYGHRKSSLTFTVKGVVMDRMLFVHGASSAASSFHQLELNVGEIVLPGVSLERDSGYAELYAEFETNCDKLAGGLANKFVAKSGFEESVEDNQVEMETETEEQTTTTTTNTSRNNRSNRSNRSNRNDDDDDDYDPLRIGPVRRGNSRGMIGIGDGFDDTLPGGGFGLGGVPPMVGGGIGFGGSSGGGSLVGPNHPGFGGSGNGLSRGNRGNRGTSSGGIRLPRGAVPPGARFDPFGPDINNTGGSTFRDDDDEDQPPPGMYF